MTVKERLHATVDELDDQSAAEIIAFPLRTSGRVAESPDRSSSPAEPGVDVDRERFWQIARPITRDDPFWSIPGLLDDDGPPDMSSNKHAHLARLDADLRDN